jgi:hypothetical protein
MKARDEAIQEILDRHGPEAVCGASTGYVSRAVHALAGDDHTVFYMQGSMGLAPAIGLGIALNVSRPVVVLNGDASLLMALGSTHTIRDRAPTPRRATVTTRLHFEIDSTQMTPLVEGLLARVAEREQRLLQANRSRSLVSRMQLWASTPIPG